MFFKNGFVLFPVLAISGILAAAGLLGWVVIPNSPQLYGKSIRNIKTSEKVVALTFDDGPNPPYTSQVLDVLKKHDVKATFFVVGIRAQKYPDSVIQVYQAGHEIGNHSWSHHVLIGKSYKFIRKEIDSTDEFIRSLGYTGTIHFRAPKGMKFVRLPKILDETNRPHILFDAVGWDWSSPGANKIVNNVMSSVKPGSVILLHDGDGDNNEVITDRSQTVDATDTIIQRLKAEGYKFVTISELLNHSNN